MVFFRRAVIHFKGVTKGHALIFLYYRVRAMLLDGRMRKSLPLLHQHTRITPVRAGL